ncbi:DUF1857-domain-containing protein [Amniculicola lignicola CBS 123094]|uniref:DUF1857-domain-containing protein n=1 Tax=Amniculicola lignicola CBS 123094 TaxID=1392246 RepID=A0A6A5W6N1_9PLEO|nr:DUF1857-domain-containing protein [Amniculicola lignicola CBS 123094]
MVNISLAYTAKINPSGVTPVLTKRQVWAGLQRKIRFAQEFVPVIESCEVLEDKDGIVDRKVVFKPGMPKSEAREIVRGYEDAWVDFEQEDGTHIRNIISDGSSGDLDDLHMTYMFEFRLPHVQEGEQGQQQKEKLEKTSKMAVESSIEAIRKMVVDGRIAA